MLPEGVTLTRGPLGGYVVHLRGQFMGWIHSSGDLWTAHRRTGGSVGLMLGRFPHDDAVRAIIADPASSGGTTCA